MRPEFITEADITRWSKNYEEETRHQADMPSFLFDSPIIREVCYAGMWLCEELEKLNCSPELITRIQFTAGGMSFGRDPWAAHQKVLEAYRNNELKLEADPSAAN
jgi:hypothetical protein